MNRNNNSNRTMYLTQDFNFGEFIQTYRERHNITQTDLAKMSGLRQPQISRIENNSNIKVSTLVKILNSLDLSLEAEGITNSLVDKNNNLLIGNLISYQRKRNNMTQVELAEKTKLKQPQIVHIEKNHDITLHTLQKVLKTLNLKLKITRYITEKTG